MNKRPKLPSGRPVKELICSTVAAMKSELRRNMLRRKPAGEVSPDADQWQSAREVLELGRVMNRWPEIVGPALHQHCYPARLWQGNLQVVCADSQWMQTFQFYRGLVREKIAELFPGTPVRRVFSRVGNIPAGILPAIEEPWPDWQAQTGIEPDPNLPSPTGMVIDECRKKLSARRQGLEARGYRLCDRCRANMVAQGTSSCSVCLFRHQQELRSQVRELLFDLPWLGREAIQERIPEASAVMIDEAREELLAESHLRLEEGSDAFEQGDAHLTQVDFSWEVLRYLILKTGFPPQEIDFEEPFFQGFLPPKCLKWALFEEEKVSC